MEPLPAPLRDRPFTLDDVRAAGLSIERARRSDVQHPHHGVHIAHAPEGTLAERCRTLLPVLDERHVFAGLTAAELWGAPLPWLGSRGDDLHVLAIGARGRLERPGVVSWETEANGVQATVLSGLPVVGPADAWAQLSALPVRRFAEFDVPWLVAVGDYLLSERRLDGARTPALCTRADLVQAAMRRRGKRGAKRLSRALELVRPGPQSPKESLLRIGLMDAGLPEPSIQVPVETAAGRRHGDLGYPHARLLLEYQGDHHRTSRRQWLEDLTRTQLFEDAGYRTILVGDADMHPDCRALAARISRALHT